MHVRHAIVTVILAFSCGLSAGAQAPKAAAPSAPAAPAKAPPAGTVPAAAPAAPAVDPKAKAIWDKSVAATRALKGVEMRSRMQMPDGGPGIPPGMAPEGMFDEHRVVIAFTQPGKDDELGMDGGLPGTFRIERMAAGAPSKVLVMDAKGAIMIDPKAKTWYGGEEWPEIAGTMMVAIPDWYMELRVRGDKDAEARELLGGPEAQPIRIDAMSVVGTETLDGVECDLVKVHRKMDPEDAGLPEGAPAGMTETYAFARTDGLPRRVTRAGDFGPDGAEGEAGAVPMMVAPALVYTGVKANPAIDAKAFSKDVPEGYAKVDAPKDPFGMGGGPIGGGEAEAQIPQLKVKVGDAAPEFALKDLDGKEVTLASLRGKVVLLDFWATWCGPCKAAMPGIQKIHEDYAGKDVVVLGVNAMEPGDGSKARDYVQSKKYTYGCLLKGDQLAAAYGVTGIPTLVIVGKDGKVAFAEVGFGDGGAAGLRKAIDAALAK